MTSEDIRSAENVKRGFMHGVFRHPALITTHLKRLFGNANMEILNQTDTTFDVNCKSSEISATSFNRTFRFTFVSREDGTNKITNVEEV